MYHGAMPKDPDEMYPEDQVLFALLLPAREAKELEDIHRALWGDKQ
jgi:hypothetical protein